MYSQRFTWLVIGACGGLLLLTGAALAEGDAKGGIAPQPLTNALAEFAEQSGLQLVYLTELTEGIETEGAEPTEMPERVLDQLLADTGLRYEFINDRTVSIEPKKTSSDTNPEPRSLGNSQPALNSVLMAQNQTPALQNQTSQSNQTDDNEDQTKPFLIEEIIVTGTNLRGVTNTASPLIQFDRRDIEASGVPTAAEFIRRAIPQNFAGGAAEDQFGTTRSGVENLGNGTSVNLRGLGVASTLVLLNGRRLAGSGSSAFTDVSMIPVSALDRIDIVADGASAIYGSDAVGGVVNFVLTDDFEGAETRVRFGPDLGNDYDEIQLGQSFGTRWHSGNGLISYEYYDRSNLDTADRARTADSLDPTDNLPAQERHSVFAAVNQKITERIELFGTTLFSRRDVESNSVNTFSLDVFESEQENQQFSVNSGAAFDIGHSSSWQVEISGTVGGNEIDSGANNLTQGIPSADIFNESDQWIIDAKLDGNLAEIGGGIIKLAVGAQLRDESLESQSDTASLNFNLDRDVTAGFAEVFLPLVGENNRRSGIERLELTFAGRYEYYSDFGDSIDPKIGLLWAPTRSLNIRGTWGTSFRAPLLTEIIDSVSFLAYIRIPDPDAVDPSGTSSAAIVTGNSPDVLPEEADTWTVGVDYEPESIPRLKLSLTYFGVDYDNRILRPDASSGRFFTWLTDPLFAPIVDRNFDPAVVADLETRAVAQGFFADLTGAGLAGVEVFLDGRLTNFASTELSGLDASAAHSFESDIGSWSLTLSGTYYDTNKQTIGAGNASEIAGTVYNPADLRLRGGIGWSRGGLAANAFVNYTSGLDDNREGAPTTSIPSWTTVDLQLSADFGQWSRMAALEGLSINISANNLFDRDAPFVEDFGRDRNYDPENHDVLGRFVVLGLTYDW